MDLWDTLTHIRFSQDLRVLGKDVTTFNCYKVSAGFGYSFCWKLH